jgi:hypothetical protein
MKNTISIIDEIKLENLTSKQPKIEEINDKFSSLLNNDADENKEEQENSTFCEHTQYVKTQAFLNKILIESAA